MARLLLQALGVGTGKRERDVIDELFDAFGLDFATLDVSVPSDAADRAKVVREKGAAALANAAPDLAALLTAVLRCGGRFVGMLAAVYERLSRHTANEQGTSQTFRLERDGVDESRLTINEAMIEEVRRLQRQLVQVRTGRFAQQALLSFTMPDNGEFYGRWPSGPGRDGVRLLHEVLLLRWFALERAGYSSPEPELAETFAAAERLVTASEGLVAAYVATVDAYANTSAAEVVIATTDVSLKDWEQEDAVGRDRAVPGRWAAGCDGSRRDSHTSHQQECVGTGPHLAGTCGRHARILAFKRSRQLGWIRGPVA